MLLWIRFNLFDFTAAAVIVQFIVLILIVLYILFWQQKTQSSAEKTQKRVMRLAALIETYVQEEKTLNPASLKSNPEEICECVLKWDPNDKRPRWIEIRNVLFNSFLLPFAHKYAHSKQWRERLRAVTIFLIDPSPQNESFLLRLVGDQTPLIKYTAAQCLSKMGSTVGVDAILQLMSTSPRLLRYPFHDALQQGGETVAALLKAKLEVEKDPAIRVSCIEVLSKKMDAPLFSLIKDDIHSPVKNLKIAAIRALGHYPTQSSSEALVSVLEDQDWEARALAARSLGYLQAVDRKEQLEKLLVDPVWWVRMNAALALKRLGAPGEAILKRQKIEDDRFAYEVAHYALAFKL